MASASRNRRLAALERALLPPAESYAHWDARERQYARLRIMGLWMFLAAGPERASRIAGYVWDHWRPSGLWGHHRGPRPDPSDFEPDRLRKHLLSAVRDFRAMPAGDWHKDQEINPLLAPPTTATPLSILLSNPGKLTCAPRLETLTKLLPHYTAP